jgi:alpha-beta hydrolase superfamily lysophospholipase
MEHKEFNLVSKDGTYLAGRFWKPSGYPRASLCIVHGIGEHSGRYDSWARKFCDKGIMVYAIDLRGHGHSEGQQGHIDHLSDFFDDINALVRRSKRNWGNLPQFIYGHSMGGALVLSFLLKRRQDFSGAIISSPWLQLVKPPGAFIQKMATFLDKVLPRISFHTGIKSTQLTQEAESQAQTDNDKLMHHHISVRLFNQLNGATSQVLKQANGFNLPLFFSHGSADTLTSFEATRHYATRVGSMATFFPSEGASHEVHREANADEFFEGIMRWMEPKLKKNSLV